MTGLNLGIDFDNTIICYDHVFHAVAVEQGLVAPETPRTKDGVRDTLRRLGREDDWTGLQGYVYGCRLRDAEPFPGVLGFFEAALGAGVPVAIISHKTRTPYKGPAYDLHAAALDWLDFTGFFDRLGLPRQAVSFSEAKTGKLQKIKEFGCTHFIDDLPEILLAPEFPAGVQGLLFGPAETPAPLTRFLSWGNLRSHFEALWRVPA